MSMEFGNDNEIRGGGGGFATGLAMGSMTNRNDDRGHSTLMMAAIIIVVLFFVAIIFLALAFKDKDRGHVNGTTDVAALLTPLIAAKSMESNGSNSNFDMLEIKAKLEHNEDRATARETQQIISQQGQSFMQLGFGLSNQIKDSEKDNLKEFGEIKQQLGIQGQALQQLLTVQNNSAIINGVIQQLTMGAPCVARC